MKPHSITISDIVQKETLTAEDLEALREIRRFGSNSFVISYLDSLLVDAATYRHKVVEDNPDLALRLFNIYRDVVIGNHFVAYHENNPTYRSTLRDIRESLRAGGGNLPTDGTPISL